MNKFYYFTIERKKDEAIIESTEEYDIIKLKRGNFTPNEPFQLKQSEGKVFYDIVGYQDTANFAISEKLHTLLKKNNISGWDSYQIEIEGQTKRYYGFQVTGRCGELDMPKEAGFYTGYKFDFDTWDKSDFFSPNQTTLLFCTEKVRKLLKENKITNTEIEDINAVKTYSIGSS